MFYVTYKYLEFFCLTFLYKQRILQQNQDNSF